jgi:hypothetical protein
VAVVAVVVVATVVVVAACYLMNGVMLCSINGIDIQVDWFGPHFTWVRRASRCALIPV